MPEWPEVTITTSSLQELCAGKTLVRVKVRYVLKHNVAPLAAIQTVLPVEIEQVTRKGKNIIFELEGGQRMLSHMMLTGSWSKTKNEHVCVTLVLASGERLYYRDTRRFGRLCFCTEAAANAYLAKVQPDMFTLTLEEFLQGMRRKNRCGIYSCIMDQNAVVSGVGNYVAAESLYRARLHPQAKIGKLTDDHLETLLEAIREVCTQSLEAQGMTVSDYVTIEGHAGTYQDLLKVYKRSEHKLKISGRNCYWDPEVQTIK